MSLLTPVGVLPIPYDVVPPRRDRPETAEAWRKAVRQAMNTAFGPDYEAVAFHRQDERRLGYILAHAIGG